ncbi:MAG: GNAT family N-acetyltransferase [Candidatus Dormibacteraeota bacterium]|nr:GNAT family N-acetyltransferase [Candidatus Dormibacteraeota bacterium]
MSALALRDGSLVELRPLEASDRVRLVRLFYRLSPETVYHRFLSPLHDPSDSGLDRLVDLDHNDREAIAAISGDDVVGVARYFRDHSASAADIAVLIEDGWQGRGLGAVLLEHLREIAAGRGIEAFTATILSENRPATGLVRKLFPHAIFTLDGPELTALMPFGASLP